MLAVMETVGRLTPSICDINSCVIGKVGSCTRSSVNRSQRAKRSSTEWLRMRGGTLCRAIGRVDVGHPGRIGPTPGSIVPRIGPELARLGAAAARIEHGCGGLVRKQLGRGLQFVEQALVHRAQVEGGPPDPVSQGGAVEHQTLTGVDLGLAIQRKMVGEL